MIKYRFTSIAASFIFVSLFFVLLAYPKLIYWLFQITENESASFAFRRAAMMFLGLSVITWFSRDAPNSSARQAICAGISVLMFALAMLGCIEYLRGAAGVGIWIAVFTELLCVVCFGGVWLRNRSA